MHLQRDAPGEALSNLLSDFGLFIAKHPGSYYGGLISRSRGYGDRDNSALGNSVSLSCRSSHLKSSSLVDRMNVRSSSSGVHHGNMKLIPTSAIDLINELNWNHMFSENENRIIYLIHI